MKELNVKLESHYATHGKQLPQRVFSDQVLTNAQARRYSILTGKESGSQNGLYLFTTVTRNIQDQLPDLTAAIAVIVDTLGPSRVAFSIVEGPSDDITASTLDDVLYPFLLSLGVPASRIRFVTNSPRLDFNQGDRIGLLAQLRNQALEPLWHNAEGHDNESGLGAQVRAVIMFNDVYLKAEHFLEVLYWHHVNQAGITTAWDWWKRNPGYYYDVWVGRTVDTGDLFYPMDPSLEKWQPSSDVFADSPASRKAFDSLEPFPVFSSWNGLAVLDPRPLLGSSSPAFSSNTRGVRFRSASADAHECAASECALICSDYWKAGFGKVQVVPSVQLAYDRGTAMETEQMMQKQRRELGWVNGVPKKMPRRGSSRYWPDQ